MTNQAYTNPIINQPQFFQAAFLSVALRESLKTVLDLEITPTLEEMNLFSHQLETLQEAFMSSVRSSMTKLYKEYSSPIPSPQSILTMYSTISGLISWSDSIRNLPFITHGMNTGIVSLQKSPTSQANVTHINPHQNTSASSVPGNYL